jgi:hypothetical protein
MSKVTTGQKSGSFLEVVSSPPSPVFDLAAEIHRSLATLTTLPALKDIFVEAHGAGAVALEAVWNAPQKEVGNFRAWPVFLGMRHSIVEGAAFNRGDLERSFPEYFPDGQPSRIRGAIGEAVRNIGQHGHRYQDGYPAIVNGVAVFAPGAVFAREIVSQDSQGQAHKMLVVMVSDEGRGVAKPQESLLHGVGGCEGTEHLGMGYELEGTLLYLVKSRVDNGGGEWILFDGLHTQQAVPENSRSGGWGRSAEGKCIDPIQTVDLPKPPRGCQKIMFFAHPETNTQGVFDEVQKAISQLAS